MKDKRSFGRVVAKDDRDFGYILEAPKKTGHTSRFWANNGWHGDQGANSSCVGYAWAHWLHAAPYRQKLEPEGIYMLSKHFDRWEGEEYDGTSVRGGARVLKMIGLLGKYQWTWDAEVIKGHVLANGPVVIGVNWHERMNNVSSDGMMRAIGRVMGGHAVCVNGFSAKNNTFRIKNSWGKSWGQRGYGNLPFSDMQLLLENDGEACVGFEKKATIYT